MKKIITGAVILFFVYLLVACSANIDQSTFRVQMPSNLTIERNILTFDKVTGAKSYILSINGVNTEIDDTTYVFTEDGTYKVRIQALSGVEDVANSLFTDVLEFKVRFLQYPDDIQVVNNQVFFTEDLDADSYDIEINGKLYNSEADLPSYLEPGTFDIRVKARSEAYNESEFSPVRTVTVRKEDRLYTKHNYQYSVNSTFELPLYTYRTAGLNYIEVIETHITKEEVIKGDKLLERRDFYAANQTVYLSTSYMNYLRKLLGESENTSNLVVTFVVHTNLGDHDISLTLNMLNTPYSYSGSRQSSNFNDNVVFGFETFGYTFVKLEGHGITDDDYSYDDDILTIQTKYLISTYSSKRSVGDLEYILTFEKEGIAHKYSIFISK